MQLEIYDVLGQKVRVLVDEKQAGGQYRVMWDGRDEMGSEVSSGVYFYRLQADSFRAVRKLILIK